MAPSLVNPNPELPIIVEVDASLMGIGAVLSQWSIADNKVDPCSFFFQMPVSSKEKL